MLDFLRRFKSGIEAESGNRPAVRDLLLVAYCRTLIGLSQAAFNHQSMSFKDALSSQPSGTALERRFDEVLRFVLDAAADNLAETARVVLGGARKLP